MLQIGPYTFPNRLALAPMAGVTDRPFRQLCRSLGAGMTVSEMVTSQPQLRHSRKTQLRLDHSGEPEPVIVQIAGSEPEQLAEAAQFNVRQGAHIIDINMGCPAKKVCKVAAGSALLRDELLVERLLKAVVKAVDVPVTLKTRTGWNDDQRNIERIAQIAEDAGIAALTLHGRTREQMYNGFAEHDSVARIKQRISIPVIANGDIISPEQAKSIMQQTGVDAIMIGRAAQSRPWIFSSIAYFLDHDRPAPEPDLSQKQAWLLRHLANLYDFYGEFMGVRIARKHIDWQLKTELAYQSVKGDLMQLYDAKQQSDLVARIFEQLGREAA